MDSLDPTLVARLHLVFTAYMAGLIWFVQVVHYPLMACIGPAEFARYEKRNTRITAWVVGPPMLAELGLAIVLVLMERSTLAWLGAGLLAVIWLSTVCLQVPAHRRLEQGFDAATHVFLVRTNWVRTGGWTARAAVAVAMVG